MRLLGNIIWHIPFCGFLVALFYYVIGLILVLLVVTAPLGLGMIELSKFLLAPFNRALISKKELNIEQNELWKKYSIIIMILYFPIGLMMFFIQLGQAIILACTLVGIPLAIIMIKSLGTIFNPVNKKCVSIAVSLELERRKASEQLDSGKF